jgi:hypothetical protein
MFIANPMALVHSNGKLDEPSSLKEAYVEHEWWDSIETYSKPIVKS